MLVPSVVAVSSGSTPSIGSQVVHRVDENLAGEEIPRELSKAVRGNGQGDDVCVVDDLVGRDGAGAGGEDVDGQGDIVGGP